MQRTLRLSRLGAALLLAATAACGGGGGGAGPVTPEPGAAQAPASTEQTLTDLFNLTALYQRMGRLAGPAPLPFVGQAAFFAGRCVPQPESHQGRRWEIPPQ